MSLAASGSHLFDFGHVSDKGVVVHKVQEPLQLVQVTDVVLADPLAKENQDDHHHY